MTLLSVIIIFHGMGKQKDITGIKFGRLTALTIDAERKAIKPRVNHWICLCECGKEISVDIRSLMNGHTQSCRCSHKKHGLTGQLPYRIWRHVLARCHNPKASHYDRYGGRGIAVCDRWKESFENFLEDMGMPFEGATIERVNNNDNYYKENCRWATRKEQSANTKRNVWLDSNGERKTLKQWAENTGVNHCTLRSRIKSGWPIEKALITPPLNFNQYSNPCSGL